MTARPLHIAYVGNFGPEHSTENHVAQALLNNGHEVTRCQENWVAIDGSGRTAFDLLAADLEGTWPGGSPPDVLLWTRTGWDWHGLGTTTEHAHQAQRHLLDVAAGEGIPTVGFHLDRWWGLNREGQVAEEPYFRCALMVTADGGHDDQWLDAGVEHVWLPPGVSRDEALRDGQRRPDLTVQVGFVGSYRTYHKEWLHHRRAMVGKLQRHYGRKFRVWEGGMRGQDLADLYASVDVLVGDSCLAGGATRYWSDRIPETLGRGGFLIHPEVDGLAEHFTAGEHLLTFPLADHEAMLGAVRWALSHPEERAKIAAAGREHVLAHHTYEVRMDELVAILTDRGLLA